ncbi:helix-turn-helix domain-containing protein [Deinococcus sonorensis]|uniref:Helix-turn-helix domain-containing protein n=2 Tax=Deinococcus sonorensis TaxID=309891 RepID=A0AAU7UC52_9DEIO
MPYQEFLPDARLRNLVHMYWQVTEYHEVHEQEHRFLPERAVRLNFYAGDSWYGSVQHPSLEPLPTAAIFGMTLGPQRVVSVGLMRVLSVEVYPWGARQLFGWRLGQDLVDLKLTHPWLCRAVCALLAMNAWEEARQMVEDWLLSLQAELGREPGVGVQAATTLYTSLGQARIGTLSEELGLSQRQLERQFLQEVGLNAKTLARLIRFEEAQNRLWLDPHRSLAALAYEVGFSDQAHLTREFQALAQVTPSAFARHTLLRLEQNRHSEPSLVRVAAETPLVPGRWSPGSPDVS